MARLGNCALKDALTQVELSLLSATKRRLVKECSFFLVNIGKDTNYKVVVERANQAAAKSDERLARYVKESMESCRDTAILS